ncbi:hypothetical protein ACIQ6Y_37350 [Streptomyces sp. NPDC096205]|uniref:hypothetical protein n=1 Tax=Streptomyces sp. NPDC096205 TaxID=3366081 RepID=UPI0038028D19
MRVDAMLFGADRGKRAAAESWLLDAAPYQPTTEAEWASAHGVALLTAGVRCDAVRVPYNVLHPGFDGGTTPDALRHLLAGLGIVGPVFCDPYRPFAYFLVPPGTDRVWGRDLAAAGMECLGGTQPYVRHVGVPHLGRVSPPGAYWLHPLDGGSLWYVDAGRLHAVLQARVKDAEKQGEAPE